MHRIRVGVGLVFMGFVAALSAFAGCGGSSEAHCNDYCETFLECPDVDPDVRRAGCDRYCSQVQDVIDGSGCDDPYQQVLDCLDKLPTVCTDDDPFEDNECDPLLEALAHCADRWCAEHDDACELPD